MDYREINKKAWNERTETHFNSEFYAVKSFIEGQTSLNEIELSLLGNIRGKSILHLQCHFGQDTISLERLGAITTGVDLSDKAIEKAQELAKETHSKATFTLSDIYELPQNLTQEFDMVYTSYGTIGWLPDLDKWAAVISHFLKPGGKFIFVEFHPVVWMFDDELKEITYTYFKSDPIIETNSGTYAEREADLELKTVSWNHSLSEVVNSLIKNGLQIEVLNEYNYSPYDCFNNTIKISDRKYRIKHLEDKIPMVYAIVATKTR